LDKKVAELANFLDVSVETLETNAFFLSLDATPIAKHAQIEEREASSSWVAT